MRATTPYNVGVVCAREIAECRSVSRWEAIWVQTSRGSTSRKFADARAQFIGRGASMLKMWNPHVGEKMGWEKT